jgi:UDP-glucose 4-epimerase
MNLERKRIVVTGGTGHIGHYLLKKLDVSGADVIMISRTKNNLNFFKNIKFVHCDISSVNSVKKIKNYLGRADYLIHLAAFVPKDKDDKDMDAAVNVKGTENIMEFIGKGTKVCYASTASVYGNTKYVPIDEKHPCSPTTYYGKSKLEAEKYISSYLRKRDNDLVILRFTNIYGCGEVIPRAIPNFISSVLNDKRPVIYGDGFDRRDFLYIEDAVEAILSTLRKWNNGTYNIASGKNYSVREIADIIMKLTGKKLKLKFENLKKPKNDFIFNVNKAKRNLKFNASTDIKEGLRNEVIWRLINDAGTIYVDFDGTLVDVNERLYRVHKFSMRHLGLKAMSKKKYIKAKRKIAVESLIIKNNYNKNIFFKYNRMRISKIEEIYYLKYDKLHANAIDILKKLKQNHKLVLVTDRKSKKNLLWQMKRFKIYHIFDKIILSRKKISRKDSIIISDTENDILIGRKLHVPVITVENGIRHRDFLMKFSPRYLIKSFSWLDEIL